MAAALASKGGPPCVPTTKSEFDVDTKAEIGDIYARLRSVEIDVTTLKAQMLDARGDITEIKTDIKRLIEAVNTNGDLAKKASNSISTAMKLGGTGIAGLGVWLSYLEMWPR